MTVQISDNCLVYFFTIDQNFHLTKQEHDSQIIVFDVLNITINEFLAYHIDWLSHCPNMNCNLAEQSLDILCLQC